MNRFLLLKEVKNNHQVLFWAGMLARNHHIQCRTTLDLVISCKAIGPENNLLKEKRL